MLAGDSKISIRSDGDSWHPRQRSSVLMSENTCIFCSKQSLALLQCSGCGNVHYCDKACQKSHWKLHKKDCKPFRICEIAGKNKGIVATKAIRQGQVIIRDRALLILKKSQIRDKVKPSRSTILSIFQYLLFRGQFYSISSKRCQLKIRRLCCPSTTKTRRRRVWRTRSWTCLRATA